MNRVAGASRVVTVLVVLLLVAGAVIIFVDRDDSRQLTVDFPRTNSLYVGSDVKILGVPVGTVDSLTPRGDSVRAEISYPSDVTLPDDVRVVIVSPSIVGDRFVQLAPAYSGGEELPDGAELGPDRTEVPVELDEVYASLNDLSVALGPDGANSDGALSRLVDDTANQLDGQGQQLNVTIQNFGRLSQTLSDNKDDLFGTVREVSQFVELLDRNDSSVRAFFDSTAEVSEVLEGEREDLALTLEALGGALVEVRRLVRDNREELRGNVDNLASIAEVLGEHEQDIEEITVNAPTALSNVALTYNGDSGTLDNHADILQLLTGAVSNLGTILCNSAEGLGLGDLVGQGCEVLGGILDDVLGGILGSIPGLPGGPAADSVAPETSESPELSAEQFADLQEGLGANRAPVASGQEPPRTLTSLEDMLAVQ